MKLQATALLIVPTVVQAGSNCHGGIDIMWLQDTTGSFVEDLPNVLEQIPDIVNKVNVQYPNTYFGVAEFKDKPYMPLGGGDEFCYKLGEGKLSGELDDFWWAYNLLYASGGGDLPEASFQALIDVALDYHVGWRPLVTAGSEPAKNESAAHVVVLTTDAAMHLPGDIEKIHRIEPGKWAELPASLPPNTGKIQYPEAVEFECIYHDYPEHTQVVAALKAQNIYLIILTPDDPEITAGWKWFNEAALGQPEEFYQFIQKDSSDFMEVLLSTLDKVTEHTCPMVETTPLPTTTYGATSAADTTPLPTTTSPPTSTYLATSVADTTPLRTTTPPGPTPPPPTTPSAETSVECICPPGQECPCGPIFLLQIGHAPKLVHVEMEN